MLGIVGMLSLIVAMLCCENAERIGYAMRVIDRPNGTRKRHTKPTPLVGGIAICLALLLLELGMLAGSPSHERFYVGLAVATAGFWFIGYLDDLLDLRPLLRVAGATSIFAIVLAIDPKMVLREIDLAGPFAALELGYFAFPFTLVCLVGLVNAINMADGRNGVVLGVSICWAFGLGEYANPFLQPFFGSLVIIFSVALIYNWNGRLFLGNSGSHLLGAVLGLLTIYSYNDPKSSIPAAAAAIWLIVPVLDCIRLIFFRLRRNRSPWSSDEEHFHHYLSDALDWPIAIFVYLSVAAAPGFMALFYPDRAVYFLVATALLYAMTLFWVLRRPATRVRVQERRAQEDGI